MNRVSRFRDVVITGLGAVSPLGLAAGDSLAELHAGRTGLRALTAFDLEGELSGEVPPFDLRSRLVKPKSEKLMSRATRLAMYAAGDALAGVDLGAIDRERFAIEVGSGHSGIDYDEFFPALEVAWKGAPERDFSQLGGRASKLIDAYFSLRTLSNAGVGLLAAEYDLRGPSNNYVQYDGAAAWALAAAAADIDDGRADAALAGGYDSLLTKSAYLSYLDWGLLSPGRPMTPFAADRSGITLGEGAAFFLVESGADAAARGRRPIARLQAYLSGGDASGEGWVADGLPSLEPELREAFENGLRPDYVIARGASVRSHDQGELQLLEQLGVDLERVSAWKPWTGYLGAATAAVEVALTIQAVNAGFLPAPVAGAAPGDALTAGLPRQAIHMERSDPLILLLGGCWGGQAFALWFRAMRAEGEAR